VEKDNEEEILRNLQYNSCQGFFQSSPIECHMITESLEPLNDIRTDETGAFIYNSAFPDNDPESMIQ